jgi:hypothetical protein
MKYAIVYAGSEAALVEGVAKWIEAGWRPQGGVAVLSWRDAWNNPASQYLQAVVTGAAETS